MKAVLHQRLIVATGLCILISLASALLFVSCGRGRQSGVRSLGSGVQDKDRGTPASIFDSGLKTQDPGLPLADALAQIDAYQPPKDIDAARFATLKAELKRLLIARAETDPSLGTAGFPAGDQPLGKAAVPITGKTLSIAPVDPINAVTDLAAAYSADHTKVTLTWTEKLPGDYNNDGEVGIDDLVPLGQYYGQRTDSGPNDAHRLVDGDGTPDIDIGDLRAIATNYGAHIQGYKVARYSWNTQTGLQIEWCPNPNPLNPAWSADRPSPAPVSARPTYTYLDDVTDVSSDNGDVYYQMAAIGDGACGVISMTHLFLPPKYCISGSVTLAGGNLAGVTMTLTPGGRSTLSQSDGTFTFEGVPDGSYTLTPLKTGYMFMPLMQSVNVAGADVTVQDFAATVSAHSISGTVTSSGVGLPGVTLTLVPGGQNATTHADGTYAITGVASGTYTLTPYKMGFGLTPAYRTVLVAASDVAGQDFVGQTASGLADSAWPTVHANSRNTGLSPHVGARTNSVKWWSYAEANTLVIGSDGTLYMGGGKMYAFDPADGTMKWASNTTWWMNCPTIAADGTLFVGTNGCNVYALSPVDGSVIWSQKTLGEVSDSPAIGVDGTLYVAYVTGICALNPSDGSVKWTHSTYYLMSGSPAIGGDGTVYVGSGYDISAFDPSDGSVKWTCSTGDIVKSSPAIGPDGTVYVGSDDKNVYALNPSDGSVKWIYTTGGVVSASPAIGPDGMVYLGSGDGNLYALNPLDGTVKWIYATGNWSGSPAIGAEGTVYVGGDKMNALNPADGSIKWAFVSSRPVSGSPAVGLDGTVYVSSTYGNLYAFGP